MSVTTTTAEPIEMPFRSLTRVGPRKHADADWCALRGVHVHIGATWRIRLNRPRAAAMRPYVKLLWPLVLISCCHNKKRPTTMSAKNLLYAPIMSTLTNGLSELCKKETLWQYAWYDLHYLCLCYFCSAIQFTKCVPIQCTVHIVTYGNKSLATAWDKSDSARSRSYALFLVCMCLPSWQLLYSISNLSHCC